MRTFLAQLFRILSVCWMVVWMATATSVDQLTIYVMAAAVFYSVVAELCDERELSLPGRSDETTPPRPKRPSVSACPVCAMKVATRPGGLPQLRISNPLTKDSQMGHVQLQPRDYGLVLDPLVYSIRAITAQFLADAYGISINSAKRRLNRLAEGGFVHRYQGWVADIPPIKPIIQWDKRQPTPDFGPPANFVQRRWDNRPLKQTTLYTASNKLLAMYGLPPRERLKDHHATHDLAIAYVYDYCRRHWPQLTFVGEAIFAPDRGFGEACEDGQVRNGDELLAAIEYAGAYRKDRFLHFHKHMSERGWPYIVF